MAAAMGEERGTGCAIDDRQDARLTSPSSGSSPSGSGRFSVGVMAGRVAWLYNTVFNTHSLKDIYFTHN